MQAVQSGSLHSNAGGASSQSSHHHHDDDDDDELVAQARAESGAEQPNSWQLLRSHLERTIADSERLSDQLKRSWDRAQTAAIRGAAAGLLLRGGEHNNGCMVSCLRAHHVADLPSDPSLRIGLHLLGRLVPKKKGKRGLTILEELADTASYTAFLASLGLVFVSVDEGIAVFFGKRRCELRTGERTVADVDNAMK